MSEEQEMPKQLTEESISETELKDLSILQLETQSTNMEVHHHPHIEKKGFKEYFLEFLMLFLAVTMGFFAENLREHLNINEQTKKSIIAVIADLKSDSVMYNESILNYNYCGRMDDTLVKMLSEKSDHTGHIYFLARNITAELNFVHPNSRTFDQLKSAGALQLIKNENILDSITSYYQSLKFFDEENKILLDKLNEVHQANSLLFDASVFQKIFSNHFLNRQQGIINVTEPENNPFFIVKDPVSLNTVIMRYHYLGAVIKENNGVSAAALEKCNNLIRYLQQQFDLQNK
jgi:hypothetical protein